MLANRWIFNEQKKKSKELNDFNGNLPMDESQGTKTEKKDYINSNANLLISEFSTNWNRKYMILFILMVTYQ